MYDTYCESSSWLSLVVPHRLVTRAKVNVNTPPAFIDCAELASPELFQTEATPGCEAIQTT